jgi:gas vesicle protein
MKKIANLFVGIFLGAFVGGIFALLFAPKSGLKFRKDLETDFVRFRGELDAAIEEPHILLEKYAEPEKEPQIS